MSYTRYRWCVVSSCKNTSVKSPEKLFIQVPDDHKMRNVWLELAKRDPMTLSTKSRLYMCEDHFNLEQDMQNFMEYKIMGSVKHVKMKANVTPSRLCCHSEKKRKLSPSQSTVTKIQKVDFIQGAEKSELVEDYMEPVASLSKSESTIANQQYMSSSAESTIYEYSDTEIMSKLTICRACLAKDIKMCDIANTRYQEVFVKLCTKLCTEGRPKTVCYLCYSQLQRCLNFMDMVNKTEEVFRRLTSSGNELNEETISSLNTNHKFIQTPLQHISLNTENIKVDISNVKLETVIDNENSLDQIKEEYLEEDRAIDKEYSIGQIKEENFEEDVYIDKEYSFEQIKEEDLGDIEEEGSVITCDSVKEEINLSGEAFTDGNDNTAEVVKDEIEFESCFENNHEDGKDFYEEIGITKSPKESHPCPFCSKSYGQKGHLNRHIKTHGGKKAKQYTCEVCGKMFLEKSTLKKHFMIHTNDRPYACPNCPTRCTQKVDLERHMMKHTGKKPFTCDICKMRFNRKSNMKLHILTHSESKPFVCSICNHSFGRKYDLNRHKKRRHTGEKPFACGICDFRSVNASYVKKHVENKHLKHVKSE